MSDDKITIGYLGTEISEDKSFQSDKEFDYDKHIAEFNEVQRTITTYSNQNRNCEKCLMIRGTVSQDVKFFLTLRWDKSI
jgi:hypothetical protein